MRGFNKTPAHPRQVFFAEFPFDNICKLEGAPTLTAVVFRDAVLSHNITTDEVAFSSFASFVYATSLLAESMSSISSNAIKQSLGVLLPSSLVVVSIETQ